MKIISPELDSTLFGLSKELIINTLTQPQCSTISRSQSWGECTKGNKRNKERIFMLKIINIMLREFGKNIPLVVSISIKVFALSDSGPRGWGLSINVFKRSRQTIFVD